ncbi:MAG: hypothetical protein II863_16465, partial [Kiritimatiellae bacterium]|nr:hypothetical protein [Kiritimatiellia bacterium]
GTAIVLKRMPHEPSVIVVTPDEDNYAVEVKYSLFKKDAGGSQFIATENGADAQNCVPPVPDLRRVPDRVFKDLSVLAAARETYARPNPPGKTRKGANPVIFYLGDSTTRNGSAGNGGNGMGEWGWAFFSQMWFDPEKATCENHALGGLSARSFYRDYWAPIKANLKPGDFVVIGFGHNDGGKNWDTRSAISGTSATATKEVVNRKGDNETVYSFGEYLRKFVRETREAGATPVLVSMTARGGFNADGQPGLNRSQRLWTKDIADEMGVSFIDIGQKAFDYYSKYGQWKVNQFFGGKAGGLHTGLRGAWENAWYHALCIWEDKANPLHSLVLDPTPPKLAVTRTPGKPYVFEIWGRDISVAQEDSAAGMPRP